MRWVPTEAERRLWQRLRDRRLGPRFRRQFVVGEYIVDFVCLEIGLVIEVDGAAHATQDGQTYDEHRSAYLESRGFTVLRFWNAEILQTLDAVVTRIQDRLADLQPGSF